MSKMAVPLEMNPLRVCHFCGFEAYTEEDLKRFRKDRLSLYGRRNSCKKCFNENRSRRAELVEIFRARQTGLRCHFCEEEVTKFEGRDRDSLAIHSLDGNHENWNPVNKVPAHSGCHHSWHNTGEKNCRWQGDKASKRIKYQREWRRQKHNFETKTCCERIV